MQTTTNRPESTLNPQSGHRRKNGSNESPAPRHADVGDEYLLPVPGLLGSMLNEPESVLELLGQTLYEHRLAIARYAASLPARERVALCQALAFSEMVASRSEFVSTDLDSGLLPTALQDLAATLDVEAYLKKSDAQPSAANHS